MKKLNKKDLAKVVQEKGLTGVEAENVVDAILTKLTDAFKNMQGVELRGFGSFMPKVKLGGKRRNPKTGEAVFVADSRTVRFKLSKEHKSL